MRGCPRKVNACCKTQSCWPLCSSAPASLSMLQTSSLSSSLAATVECWTLRTAGGSNQWRRRRPRPAVICNQRLSYCLNSFSLSSILPSRGLALECFWCALRRPVRDQVAAATSRHIYTVSTLSPSRLGLDQAIWVRRGFALSLSHTFY